MYTYSLHAFLSLEYLTLLYTLYRIIYCMILDLLIYQSKKMF